MSVAAVRRDLAVRAPELIVQESDASTATVEEAAAVVGVEPGQIAKTLALILDEPLLIVMRGDMRLDNALFRKAFGRKPKMLDAARTEEVTGHRIGGVCPFGLPSAIRTVCDIGLRAFPLVFPAAGEANAWISLSPERLAELTGGEWAELASARPVAHRQS